MTGPLQQGLEPHHQFTDKLVLFADLRAAAGVPVFFVIESYVGGEQRVAYAEGEAYGHTVAFRVRQGKLSGRLAVGVLDEAALAGGVVLHPVISAQIGDAFQKAAFLAHALAPDGHRVERIAVCEGLRVVALVQEFRLQVKVAQPGNRLSSGVECSGPGSAT